MPASFQTDQAARKAQLAPLKRKRRHLQRIANTYRKISVFRLISPREDFARLIAFLVVVGLVGTTHQLIDQAVTTNFLIGFYGLVLLAGFVAHRLALRWSKRPWTYVSLLDSLLARYDPVDLDAYRRLQDDARSRGSIAKANVTGWLDNEFLALANAMPTVPPDTHLFLDKKL